jgi:hypothetical protein
MRPRTGPPDHSQVIEMIWKARTAVDPGRSRLWRSRIDPYRAPAESGPPRRAGADVRSLVLRLLAGEVRRGALLAFGADRAIRDQLADRQREVLGGGPQLLVDLLDAQTGVRLDERAELLRQGGVRLPPRPPRGRPMRPRLAGAAATAPLDPPRGARPLNADSSVSSAARRASSVICATKPCTVRFISFWKSLIRVLVQSTDSNRCCDFSIEAFAIQR